MRTPLPLLALPGLLACTGGPGDTGDSSDTSDTSATTACDWTSTSSLVGASLAGGDADCDWRLADADAGVDVGWTLTITEAAEVTVDMVSCVQVDASGLRFLEYVSADPDGAAADTWCPRCDVGICPVDEATYTTVVGTWPSTLTWRPRRWDGPSDYGAQPGDLFLPGEYTILIRAGGTLVADGSRWEVSASAPLTLRE